MACVFMCVRVCVCVVRIMACEEQDPINVDRKEYDISVDHLYKWAQRKGER